MVCWTGSDVYPKEIDDVVSEYGKVLEVATIGVADHYRGEVIHCFVRLAEPLENLDELRQYCECNLAHYKVPSVFHVVGALLINEKLEAGDSAPELSVKSLNDNFIHIGGNEAEASPKSTLIFFMSPECMICKSLLPAVRSSSIAEMNWLNVIYASDGEEYDHQKYATENGLELGAYVLSEGLGRAFGVSKLPYAVLNDEKDKIVSMGLVNTREQIESLFNAKELGAPSPQDFLAKKSPAV